MMWDRIRCCCRRRRSQCRNVMVIYTVGFCFFSGTTLRIDSPFFFSTIRIRSLSICHVTSVDDVMHKGSREEVCIGYDRNKFFFLLLAALTMPLVGFWARRSSARGWADSCFAGSPGEEPLRAWDNGRDPPLPHGGWVRAWHVGGAFGARVAARLGAGVGWGLWVDQFFNVYFFWGAMKWRWGKVDLGGWYYNPLTHEHVYLVSCNIPLLPLPP